MASTLQAVCNKRSAGQIPSSMLAGSFSLSLVIYTKEADGFVMSTEQTGPWFKLSSPPAALYCTVPTTLTHREARQFCLTSLFMLAKVVLVAVRPLLLEVF